MAHKIKIGWLRFRVPAAWKELTPKQAERLYAAISTVSDKQPIYTIYRNRLLALLPQWTKYFLYFYIRPDEWVETRALTLWAEEEPTPSEAQLRVIRRKKPQLQKMSFGEFIKAETLAAQTNAPGLAAHLYKEQQVPRLTALLTWHVYMDFRQKLERKFRHAFGGGGGVVAPQQVGESWAKVLMALAEKSINLEQYSKLPAATVLFELDTKIEANKELTAKR